MVHQENENDVDSIGPSCASSLKRASPLPNRNESHTPKAHEVFAETKFPASVSVSEFMQAGKLVRPKAKQKATLLLEKFDVKTGEWNTETTLQLLVDAEKFSSGGFRDACSCLLKYFSIWLCSSCHHLSIYMYLK